MTTIAADLRSMASDQRVTGGGPMISAIKTRRIRGSIYGGCGNVSQILKMFEWFQNPDMKPDWKFVPEFEILQLSPDGLFIYESEMIAIPIANPFFAIGSGSSYAMGAMEKGATIQQAVKIASKYDEATGPTVYTQSLRTARRKRK